MIENIYQKSDDIVSRKIADEVILVPISNNVGDMESIYTLNEVGAWIWELIDGKRGLVDLKNSIVQEFEVSAEKAENDVIEFLNGLKEVKAIEEVKDL